MDTPDEPKTPPESATPQGKDGSESRIIPVIQEEVFVSRVAEETGNALRVRIASHETKERIPLADTVEEVAIERVPINRYVNERSAPREEGGVVIIPVFETVAVVEMRLLLKEELRIVRQRREIAREEEVVVRKETAVVEHKTPDTPDWRPDVADDNK